jgi:hypothetical protein
MAKDLTLEHDRGMPSDVAAILKKPISQEMLDRDLARLAYVAKDGTPRVVPIAFTWNGTEAVMCTSTNAPKLASLRRNPAVALTIDTEVHPPTILLLRGEAVLDEVEGIPDEYLQMNGTYEMTAEQRAEWETEVRSLYDSMVRIVVKPTWAKLIDFHETLPSAVEELIRRRQERQELSPGCPDRGAATLRVAHDADVVAQVEVGKLAGGPHDVERAAGLADTVHEGVDARPADALVVGDGGDQPCRATADSTRNASAARSVNVVSVPSTAREMAQPSAIPLEPRA